MRSKQRILWSASTSILLLNSLSIKEVYLHPNIDIYSIKGFVQMKSEKSKHYTMKLKDFCNRRTP
jgi:hypothetical protein